MIHYHTDGMDVTELKQDRSKEFFITITVCGDESPIAIQRKLIHFLQINDNATIVKADLFSPAAEWINEFRSLLPNLPMSCISSDLCGPVVEAGIYLHAVSGMEVRPVVMNGYRVGSLFENEWMKCLYLADFQPESNRMSRIDQAGQTFNAISEILKSEGLGFSNVVRTWLYLDEILYWYSDFNHVRTSFFETNKIYDGIVPASTGVGGRNPNETALVAGIYAVKSKNSLVSIRGIPSPLQCPALKYGSSFSRAIEISVSGQRQLIISGTASIDPDGKSLHPGDVVAQIDQTMKVVLAILNSRKMNWENINRAIVYFKHAADHEHFNSYCANLGIPDFPRLLVEADICRDELLFEIEVDAISPET